MSKYLGLSKQKKTVSASNNQTSYTHPLLIISYLRQVQPSKHLP